MFLFRSLLQFSLIFLLLYLSESRLKKILLKSPPPLTVLLAEKEILINRVHGLHRIHLYIHDHLYACVLRFNKCPHSLHQLFCRKLYSSSFSLKYVYHKYM